MSPTSDPSRYIENTPEVVGPRDVASKRITSESSTVSASPGSVPGASNESSRESASNRSKASIRKGDSPTSEPSNERRNAAPSYARTSSFAAATPPTVVPALSVIQSEGAGSGGGGGTGGDPACVRAPVPGSRAKTETALLQNDAAYTVAPSGLTATERVPSRATPSAHESAPVSFTQPAVPAGCVSRPVDGSRESTAPAAAISEPP